MTPFEIIEAEYDRRPRAEPFLYYLRLYAAKGFVFSRPDFFVMGRPVERAAGRDAIFDDHREFSNPDCWYVFAAAGNTARMWQVVPWQLPWFAWTRLSDPLSELQIVSTDRLKRLCPPDLNET